jgi:hypothetical protein
MVLKKMGCKGGERIHLAQDMVQWQALMNMVMNLEVPLNTVNFLIS